MDKNQVIIRNKITIGISACCMGCPVRYNGKGTNTRDHLGRERSDFIWCPVCPECMAGLGVIRKPIHISGENGSGVWNQKSEVIQRGGKIVTSDVKEGSKACLETLLRAKATAYIYMDGSPTCGVYRTSLKKQKRGNPPGVFGSLLLDNMLFLIPSTDLQSPLKWWDWRRRLLAFYWLKEAIIKDKKDIYDIWYKLKFLCQELDNEWSRKLGKELATPPQNLTPEYIENFRKGIMELLRKPSTTARIKNSLWKSYSYYRKAKNKKVEEVHSPEFKRNVTTIAKELILMERKAVEDGILFGTSPVVYRANSL